MLLNNMQLEKAKANLARIIDIIDDDIKVCDNNCTTITVAILGKDEDTVEKWQLKDNNEMIMRNGESYHIDRNRLAHSKDLLYYWCDEGERCKRITVCANVMTNMFCGDAWTSMTAGKWQRGDIGETCLFQAKMDI
ncbi:hypothetical protein MP638_005843 [Amoeboaphelidium occidentale]|nr:hypothetical protein MP638_005843 [Amoeboaphelidium occidentale]